MRLWFFIFAAMIAAVSFAQESFTDYPDLPPLQTVKELMDNSPMVQAVQAGIKLEEANARKLTAGPYEFTAKFTEKQRRVRENGSFNEWDAALERGLRLPAKVAIDQQLGAQGINLAKLAYGDALHESGRNLLRLWFVWQQEHVQAKQWQSQVNALGEQLNIVRKRVAAGDAPQLEVSLAEAALAQAEYALRQATLREQMAATDVTQRYVGITLPSDPPLVAPEPLQEGLDYWREKILEHNHELALVRGETQRAQLHLHRSSADKTPDPAIGINYSSERGGEDHITGVFLSIPLPGEARRANESGALAQSEIAAYNEAKVLRRLGAEIANAYSNAVAAYDSWQKAKVAADGMQRNAELMTRAYSLGEMGLPEVLLARRQALEAGLAASLAQLNARESRYRLLLDSHQLWPLDRDEDETHTHY